MNTLTEQKNLVVVFLNFTLVDGTIGPCNIVLQRTCDVIWRIQNCLWTHADMALFDHGHCLFHRLCHLQLNQHDCQPSTTMVVSGTITVFIKYRWKEHSQVTLVPWLIVWSESKWIGDDQRRQTNGNKMWLKLHVDSIISLNGTREENKAYRQNMETVTASHWDNAPFCEIIPILKSLSSSWVDNVSRTGSVGGIRVSSCANFLIDPQRIL